MCFLKGNLIFVTDGNGNPLQHPIKMSGTACNPNFLLGRADHTKSYLLAMAVFITFTQRSSLWMMQNGDVKFESIRIFQTTKHLYICYKNKRVNPIHSNHLKVKGLLIIHLSKTFVVIFGESDQTVLI